MSDRWETVWTFYTRRYAVRLAVADEVHSPADHFDNPADIAFAEESGWHWFEARVQVVFRDVDNPKNWAAMRERLLGEEYLGGCSYYDLADFRAGTSFRYMVSEAIREARGTIARMCGGLRGGV